MTSELDTESRGTPKPLSQPLPKSLSQRLLAEFLGTMFLLVGVIGSGIMAQRLSSDVGLQLLQNALATAGVLVAVISAFAWVSGAHFNPAVTLAARLLGEISSRDAAAYCLSQVAGAVCGTVLANLMFDLPAVAWSTTDRSSPNLLLSEVVATVGLLLAIWGTQRSGHSSSIPIVVASYIGGAYYFTSSTSFANPAVTLARTLSDTFAGIAPASAPAFILCQLVGSGVAFVTIRVVFYTDAND